MGRSEASDREGRDREVADPMRGFLVTAIGAATRSVQEAKREIEHAFPRAAFSPLPDARKLASPEFEKMSGGVQLGNAPSVKQARMVAIPIPHGVRAVSALKPDRMVAHRAAVSRLNAAMTALAQTRAEIAGLCSAATRQLRKDIEAFDRECMALEATLERMAAADGALTLGRRMEPVTVRGPRGRFVTVSRVTLGLAPQAAVTGWAHMRDSLRAEFDETAD